MSVNREIEFLSENEVNHILNSIESLKHRLIILLMCDAGLRVSETVTLKLSDFDFRKKTLNCRSLKKRDKEKNKIRKIPLTSRLISELSEYWQTLDSVKTDDFLFPANNAKSSDKANHKHMTRQAVNKYLKTHCPHIHPHLFRHTFATRLLSNGTELMVIKDLLGHKSVQTTEIYTHIPTERLRNAVQTLERRKPFFARFMDKVFGKKTLTLINVDVGLNKFLIGRENELKQILDLTNKRVNILLLGKQGIGKTHLLNNIKFNNHKILRIDDLSSPKKLLQNLVIFLMNGDKEKIKEMMFESDESMNIKITKDSTKELTDLLMKITQKHEYTIIIDDVTNITPSQVKVLEKLKNHFHFIVAARFVKIDKATFLTNFERIELNPLSRSESLLMIHKLSYDIQSSIEDYELFKNHIFDQTAGIPLFLFEMVERYRKEEILTIDRIREVKHTQAINQIDLTLVVVILLSSLMILRYYGKETGESSFTMIGGIFLIFALFARQLMNNSKRKFV
jgi:hypothetical protein